MKNITSLFLIIASVGIFFGFIRPQYDKVNEKKAEIKSYNETLQQAEDLENQIAILEKQKNALNPNDFERLEKMLPDTISNVNLIIDINNIASDSGLIIKNISIEQGDDGGEEKATTKSDSKIYNSVGLSFDVTADYTTFKSFLASLEQSLRLVDVVSLSFSPSEGGAYNFNVTLRTYWLK